MFSREDKYIQQTKLSQTLILEDKFSKIQKIAGVDQAFLGNKVISCVVILNYEDMEVIEKSFAKKITKFPYVPGLLAYREVPVILKAYEKLEKKADVILVDAHGIAHPRGFGLASHLGLLLKKSTIGVAKRGLIGEYKEPARERECSLLRYQGEQVGYVLKSKKSCRPIFISPGNLISLESSLRIVKNCLREGKLPEPLRLAHKFVNEEKRRLFLNYTPTGS